MNLEIANSEYQLCVSKGIRKELLMGIEAKVGLPELRDILKKRERQSSRKILRKLEAWDDRTRELEETFRMGVSKFYDIAKNKMQVSERIKKFYLVRCKLGINKSTTRRELTCLSHELASKNSQLAILEKHNF